MLKSDYIGTIDFLDSYCDIRHSPWGSPVASSEAFVKRLYKSEPERAFEIAEDIFTNIDDAIKYSGLPRSALDRIIKWLKGGY